jgi:hypothetical protein
VHLTPHTLRRTFASLLAEVGISPRRAMYLLGHSDPKFTMRVYQQVLDMGGPAPGVLERVLGSTVEEAFAAWSGRGVSGLKPDLAEKPSKRGGRASAPSAKKPRKCGAFLRAAEGIRTLDLLHGN